MTAFRVGEIVAVEFPFTDMQGRKRRPGIVLATDLQDLLLARLTTHVPRDAFDVALHDWAASGLPRPSTVRLVKLIAIDARLVHHSIGVLSQTDRQSLALSLERFASHVVSSLKE
jgi:mRNA interferase MazF